MLLDTVEESVNNQHCRQRTCEGLRASDRKHSRLLWEMDQLPESRASRDSECCLNRTGLCSDGERLLVRAAMEGRA